MEFYQLAIILPLCWFLATSFYRKSGKNKKKANQHRNVPSWQFQKRRLGFFQGKAKIETTVKCSFCRTFWDVLDFVVIQNKVNLFYLLYSGSLADLGLSNAFAACKIFSHKKLIVMQDFWSHIKSKYL